MAKFGFLAIMVYATSVVIGQVIIVRSVRPPRPLRAKEAPARLFLLGIMFLILPFAMRSLQAQHPNYVAITVGLLLVIAGIALSLWAQCVLGRNWVGGVGLHKNHRLITKGPYRFVRHPMYSGFLLSSIGLSIACWNLLYALMMACFIGGFLFRAYGEHHMLSERFTRQYPQYVARTGAIVPKLRK
jgi:protein-S-isoprenylcysteine O-methyltransferase Ste14